MKLLKFTLITLACLLSGFVYSQEGVTYVSLEVENPTAQILIIHAPTAIPLPPRTNIPLLLKTGEEVKFMKAFKKRPLFVVTSEMNNTVIDVVGTAKLRNMGDAETIVYIKPPRIEEAETLQPTPVIEEEIVYSGEIYTDPDEMPRFPGCEDMEGLNEKKKCSGRKQLQFIYGNLKYPTIARENKIEGRVLASFIVEKDGNISNIELVRDLGGGCGQEFLRVIKSMPKWIPGKKNNQPVRVQLHISTNFQLEG